LNSTPKGAFFGKWKFKSQRSFDPSDNKSLEAPKRKGTHKKKKINFPTWDLNPGPSDCQADLLTITPTWI
jgi:hypothetical protein